MTQLTCSKMSSIWFTTCHNCPVCFLCSCFFFTAVSLHLKQLYPTCMCACLYVYVNQMNQLNIIYQDSVKMILYWKSILCLKRFPAHPSPQMNPVFDSIHYKLQHSGYAHSYCIYSKGPLLWIWPSSKDTLLWWSNCWRPRQRLIYKAR